MARYNHTVHHILKSILPSVDIWVASTFWPIPSIFDRKLAYPSVASTVANSGFPMWFSKSESGPDVCACTVGMDAFVGYSAVVKKSPGEYS